MGIAETDYARLSKAVSHALRHEPWLYELELDDEGWVSVTQLVDALRVTRRCWAELNVTDLGEMIERSSKRRHEICAGRIRAIYGHSLPEKLKRTPSRPPAILCHGTSPASIPSIKAQGLQPMKRQYVHLSTDEATAIEVGKRKARQPALLRVRALEAYEAGVPFYEGNDRVWLAEAVPSEFIEF